MVFPREFLNFIQINFDINPLPGDITQTVFGARQRLIGIAARCAIEITGMTFFNRGDVSTELISADTQRHFNVYKSPTLYRRLINEETTSCVYWVGLNFLVMMDLLSSVFTNFFWQTEHRNSVIENTSIKDFAVIFWN